MKINALQGLFDLPLSEEERQQLSNCVREISYKKVDVIFSQGETVEDLYVIRSGLIKLVYYTSEGKELIKSFIREGDILGSLVSQLGMGGSTFSAVCIEDTLTQVLPYTMLEKMAEQNPDLLKFSMNYFRQLALKKEIREYEFLCLSAEAQYHKFLAEDPEIAARITQQDLAHYLGITPIALSRMKHRRTQT